MGFIKTGLAAVAFLASATALSATTVTLSAQNAQDLFNGGGKASITVNNSGSTHKVSAGGFRVTDGSSNFIAWCLDLANVISLPSPYSITQTPFSQTAGAFSASVQQNLQRLFNTVYSGLDLNNNAQSAGFQLALWEVIYEGKPNLNVQNGDFKWTAGSTAARNQANTFLGMMNGPETMQYNMTFFESGVDKHNKQFSQNLVSVAPIPLPAAAWLLGAGLIGLVAVGRRRREDAA